MALQVREYVNGECVCDMSNGQVSVTLQDGAKICRPPCNDGEVGAYVGMLLCGTEMKYIPQGHVAVSFYFLMDIVSYAEALLFLFNIAEARLLLWKMCM